MSLTTRIVLLVLLALAPALAIQGYNEYALHASRDATVRADTMTTARGVADDLTRVADGVRQALKLVAQDPSVRTLDPTGCTDYLRRAAAELPHVILIAVTRPDGTVACNSVGSPPGAYSNAERTYHRKALTEGGFVMGGYARGVATGKDSIHFAESLRDAVGAITAVLVAAVDLDWLSLHLESGLRLPTTSLTVADEDNVIIVRRPDGGAWIGRPIPVERQKLLAERGEGVRLDQGIDGRERILANARPTGPAGSAWITVGRDREVAFADVEAATRRGLTLMVLGAALAVVSALVAGRVVIRRPFNRLLGTAAAWRTGDLAARTGMTRQDEFGRLGSELDAMAGALQRNDADLRDQIQRASELQERQVLLLHELNHRVKNTLATVQALVRQSIRGDEASGERLEARILALSKTHDLLTQDDWSGAPLRAVLEGELEAYRRGRADVVLDGPDVDLPARHVLSLGMTLHELTTNAAKHGALSIEDGVIRIVWRVMTGESGERRLHLIWSETGNPARDRPVRRGYGSRLIAASIERELAGSVDLDLDPAGLRCRIDVPLTGQSRSMMSPVASA